MRRSIGKFDSGIRGDNDRFGDVKQDTKETSRGRGNTESRRNTERGEKEVFRVLYAEDEDLIHLSVVPHLKEVLEERARQKRLNKEIHIELVRTVQELRERLKKGNYDLLILDCRLEDGSSCGVFFENLINIPVIITTGYADPNELELVRRENPNIYAVLHKPYKLKDLEKITCSIFDKTDC